MSRPTWLKLALAALLVFPLNPLIGADPAPGFVSIFIDFSKSKGQWDYFPSDKIPDDAAVTAKNVDMERAGVLTPRRGAQTFYNIASSSYSNSGTVSSIWVWVSTRGNTYYVQKVGSNLLVTSDDMSYTERIVPTQNGVTISTAMADGVTGTSGDFLVAFNTAGRFGWRLIENGKNSVSAEGQGILCARYLRLFLDRLLVAGQGLQTIDGRKLYRISFSTPSNFLVFPASNFFDVVDLVDGDEETGMGQPLFGTTLPFYSKRSVRTITATLLPNGAIPGNENTRKISNNTGCVDQRTIQTQNNLQSFFSQGPDGTQPGIYSFNGVSIKERTKPLRRFFKDIVETSTAMYIPNAYIRSESYCLNVTTKNGIGNVWTICLDAADTPTVYNNVISTDAKSYLSIDHVASSAKGELFGISGDHISNEFGRKIYKLNTGQMDDSAPIIWNYKTKDFDLGEPASYKTADRAYLRYKWGTSTFSVIANYDFGKSSTSWVINASSNYLTTAEGLLTVAFSSGGTMVTKLIFPKSKSFNHINFELSGSSFSQIGDLQFIANKGEMR